MSFTEGKSYRLRLVNAACNTHFKFSLDHHVSMVIAADLVPIQPYTTTVLDIMTGQRYDVIVHANHSDLGNAFWLRATPQLSCSKSINADKVRGIIYYDDENTHPANIPNSTAHNFTDSCRDEDPSNLIPIISQPFDLTPLDHFYNETLPATLLKTNSFYRWQLNGTFFSQNWTRPSLRYLHNPNANNKSARKSSASSSPCLDKISLPANSIVTTEPETWVLISIESSLPVPHSVHLHGHDFLIVYQGPGPYGVLPSTTETVPRARAAGTIPNRDTALLPAGGYLVLAFRTDNPGVWLLHCHVGWHLEQGFAVSIVEQGEEVCELLSGHSGSDSKGEWAEWAQSLEENCLVWEKYEEDWQGVDKGSGV
ncbi:hypothetical protein PEBR_30893 [Penicillium brasilianum]|uniref:Multicopper oxidase n=1 Tax=Penicillium brasilianum TaxID=104259 RepID=A0A1S9RI73_PENBI|nr:hypothetical protein PEBR_30893 [Penicillium brasilianum]